MRQTYKRLRNRLVLWWYSRPPSRPKHPLHKLDDPDTAIWPSRIAGDGLIVIRGMGGGGDLVHAHDTTDEKLFWRWWRALGGEIMFDEDGDLYIPWESVNQ